MEEVHAVALSAIKGNYEEFSLWHQRLGHPSSRILQALKNDNLICFSRWNKIPSVCESCQLGKACKQPFGLSNNKSEFPLHKIHCDLWGPSPINSSQNFRYYALFVDDNTRFSWLYPLKSKTDFLDCFFKF